jgi:hypothetical protein
VNEERGPRAPVPAATSSPTNRATGRARDGATDGATDGDGATRVASAWAALLAFSPFGVGAVRVGNTSAATIAPTPNRARSAARAVRSRNTGTVSQRYRA